VSDTRTKEFEELAIRFAKAAEARDAESLIGLYHPGAHFWNNIRQQVTTTSHVVELTRLEAKVIAEYVFEDLRCTGTVGGFVVQMTATGSTRSGATFSVPTCLVAQVDKGLITRIDEYVDAAQAAPIFEELLSLLPSEPAW
jgi:ketosteroid isomerase-like protein